MNVTINENKEENEKDGVKQKFNLKKSYIYITGKYQFFLDKIVPYVFFRWAFCALCFLLFFLRVVIWNGWYVIAYCLCIYILTQILLFLSPKIDPEYDFDSLENDDETEELPMFNISKRIAGEDQPFKPFLRKLSEFNFWNRITRSVCLGIFCSLFDIFNIPVYVPILVMYFFVLCIVQFRNKIKHMIKYKYVPWTTGKSKKSEYK